MTDTLTLRAFNSEDDYTLLAEILSASEKADHSPRTVSAGEMKERLTTSPRFDLSHDLIIAEVNGQEAGYGRITWWDEPSRRTFGLTGFLRPEWRHRGIGGAILSWLEGRAQAIDREHPKEAESYIQVNATQYQTGLHALAHKAGYGIKESWVVMVRPNLTDIPEVRLPEGLEVRPVIEEHFGSIWHAVEEAYVPDGGPEPTGVIPEDFRNDANFQPELWQVAWDVSSGKVAGSVMTYINHAENKQLGIQRGYTEGISTVPAWQHRGVARALIYRSLMVQRQSGCEESALVCSGEKPYQFALYASCGFKEVKRDTVYEKLIKPEV